jgi:hypothetical protein
MRVGIDLCLRAHEPRIRKILHWLGVAAVDIDPVAAWAAVEAVLKLRGWPIEALLGRRLAVRRADTANQLVVEGLGAATAVAITEHPSYFVAFAQAQDGSVV